MPDISFPHTAAWLLGPTLVALAVVVGAALASRQRLTAGRLLTVSASASYLAVVAALTLLPLHAGFGHVTDGLRWWGAVNLVPLSDLDSTGFALNVLMTVPLGLLAPLLLPIRSLGGVALLGLVVSSTIELLQLGADLTYAAGRTVDINDVIANTAGAIAGFLVWLLLGQVAELRRALEHLALYPRAAYARS